MNPGATILVSIATSLATAIVTFLLYAPKLKADLQKEIKTRFNEQKWQAYTQFAELLPQLVECERANISPFKQEQLKNALSRIVAQITIVGSPEVMRAFDDWLQYQTRTRREREEPDPDLYAQLITAMKQDLGYTFETGILNSLLYLLHRITKPLSSKTL